MIYLVITTRKIKHTDLTLFLIILFAALIRIFRLGLVPSGFFVDEASRGLDAFSVLNSLKDTHQETLPVFFKALGEYTMPLQIYSMVPFVYLFGLSEFSVRLTSVFWSLISIILIYLIGSELKKPKLGLFAAFFLAITPWSLHYARYGAEISVYAAMFSFFLLFAIKAIKHATYLPHLLIATFLVFFSYNAAFVYIPIAFIVMFVFYSLSHKQDLLDLKRHFNFAPITVILTLLTLLVSHFVSGHAFVRWNQVTENLGFNFSSFALRYINHFSPSFLFFKGDPTFINRHFTQGLTPLLIIELPLLILGIIVSLFHYRYLVFLFLFYPLAGALPVSGPYSSRTIPGLILICLFAAIGFDSIVTFLKRKHLQRLFTSIILLLTFVNFSFFYNFYLTKYPIYSSDFWGWQQGPKEISSYFLDYQDQYDELFYPGTFNAPKTLFDFYLQSKCSKCKLGDLSNFDPKKKQLFVLSHDDFLTQNPKLT